MKHFILYLGMASLFGSCKENNVPALEMPYPHQWIFTMYASAEKYLDPELFGNSMKQ